MKNFKSHILSLLLIIIALIAVTYPADFTIISPGITRPLIRTPGETITIEIKSSIPLWQHDWRIQLQNNEHSIQLSTHDENAYFARHILELNLTANIPAGKYNLVISDQHQSHIADASIHIWPEYRDNLRIIQLADLPTFSTDGKGSGSGDAQFNQIIDEINLINPDIVLFTGDLVYGGSWAQYYQFLRAIKNINAPIIAAPGNHEYNGWSAFLTLFGTPYHVNYFGKYNVISLNSGHSRDQLTSSQFDWLTNTLAASKNKINIIQIHHSLHHKKGQRGYLKVRVGDMVEQFKQHNVPIVLSGHWHGDSVWNDQGEEQTISANFPGIPYVVTTAAGAALREKYSSSPLHHGYRLIRIENGHVINYTYDYDGDGEREATSSIPYGELKVDAISELEYRISNSLNENFDNAQVIFSTEEQHSDITTNYGKITKTSTYNSRTYYTVNFTLAAKQTINITLSTHKKES